jgi:hypothetical protein
MKNFSTYLIIVFVLWIIMTSRSANYVSLVVTNSWNVTGANLFGGIESTISNAVTGAGKAVGNSIDSGLSSVGNNLLVGLHSQEVTIT